MDDETVRLLARAIRMCNPVIEVDDMEALISLLDSMGVEIMRVA